MKTSQPFQIAIAATFTAEPLAPTLEFWSGPLHSKLEPLFAPFGQVLQTLLDPQSLFARNRHGVNVVLYRAGDLPEKEVWEAIRGRAASFTVPLLVFPCDSETSIQNVFGISPEWVDALYPVAQKSSLEGERLGAVPFTEEFYTALATAIVRRAHAVHHAPFKVLALDCDHTLWHGICGEEAVVMGPGHEALQRFAKRQREQGVLLVLSSKNNVEDVRETFARHPECPLRWEDITTHRIDWNPKPAGLRAMSSELSLGLDRFVFLDDNAREVSEVDEQLPQVLALTLPKDPRDFAAFIEHIWALDAGRITKDDAARAVSYEAVREFGKAVHAAHSMEDFYRSLELEVRIEKITAEQVGRAAQLTQRTNQFHFTTRRMTEAEVAGYAGEVLGVHVKDRFGDYGFTGLAFVRGVVVENFLLSCRVLGRRVEHRVAEFLGNLYGGGLRWEFVRTEKNAPAAAFYAELMGLAVEAAAPVAVEESVAAAHDVDYAWIAAELNGVERIRSRMRAHLEESPTLATETERALGGIWAELLREPRIAATANFFDLGGHSLLVVLLLMRVKERFGVELGIDDVYGADVTLEAMARKVDELRFYGGVGAEEYLRIVSEIDAMSEAEVERELAAHAGFARG